MKGWDLEFIESLLRARNYSEFLALFFKAKNRSWSKPNALSYQEFCNRAGYRSKSFIAEILSGKKKLTLYSLDKISKGLKLSSPWQNLLELLISLNDSKNVEERNKLQDQIDKAKAQLSYKIQNAKNITKLPVKSIEMALKHRNFPEIFAALGTLTEGASLSEIQERTNLDKKAVLTVIQTLLEANILQKKIDRFFLSSESLDYTFLNSPEYFKLDFKRSLEKLFSRFDNQVQSSNSLFQIQTFSISKDQLPRLKEKIEALISNIAEENEDPIGNTVVEICVGMTHT